MPTALVDGLRVEYTDCGVGLPIVFVPGLYGSADWFQYQSSGLSDRYRIIACETRSLRGQGERSLALLSEDLARFLDSLKIYGAVVAGHTLGASIALHLAARSPERVLAAIAVSAVPCYAGVSGEDVLARLSPGEAGPETFLTRLKNWFGKANRPPTDDSDPLAYLVRHGGTVDRATLAARLHLLMQDNISPLLPEVEVPTLVVAGSRDWSTVLSGSQAIDQLVPNAALEVIEDADHFCFFTRHDLFNALVDDFVIREVPRP